MTDVDLTGRRVLAIVTNYGVEQDELVVPVEHLTKAGAVVDIAAVEQGDVGTLVGDRDPGRTVPSTTTLADVDEIDDYDLLLIPGGAINADALRVDADAVRITRAFIQDGKPVAAICHAPWTLTEVGALRGKRLTSFPSLQTDVRNAGGEWEDSPVVVDEALGWTLITSRNPGDLAAFTGAIDDVLEAQFA